MKYRALAHRVYAEPWVLLPSELECVARVLRRKRKGGAPLAAHAASYVQSPRREAPPGVAVLPLVGLIAAKASWYVEYMGGTALEKWLPVFRQLAADPRYETIVLDVHSPGGEVAGTAEAAAEIFAARSQKRLIAVANTDMCSGAYWLASACHEIVGGPTARIGSIGAYGVALEYSHAYQGAGITPTVFRSAVSPRKADGNPYEALSAAAQKSLQSHIDRAGDMFVAAVALHRGINSEQVVDRYGGGQVLYGVEALQRRMIDRLASLDEVLAELGALPASVSPDAGGARGAIIREELHVDPNILAACRARGIVGPSATEAEATEALTAHFASLGKTLPTDPAQIMAALAATPIAGGHTAAPAAPAATPAVAAPSAGSAPATTTVSAAAGDTAAQSAPGSEQIAQMIRAAQAADRQLVAEIRAAGQGLVPFGLDPAHIETACAQETSVASARAFFAQRLAESGAPVSTVRGGALVPGAASIDVLGGAIAELIEHRALAHLRSTVSRRRGDNPAESAEGKEQQLATLGGAQLSAAASQLRHKRLVDLAHLSLSSFGIRAEAVEGDELMRVLFGTPAMMPAMAAGAAGSYSGPSTFPNILSNVMGKIADIRRQFARATFRIWCRQIPSVADFKPKTILGYGEYQELPRKNDMAGFEQSKAVGEDPAWISVEEYGDKTPFTFRMLMDDDLGMLMESIGDKSIAAELTLNRLCVELVGANPIGPDGNVLFDAAVHKNLVSPGTGITAAALEATDLLLSSQKGVDGERTIAQSSQYCVHPNKHKYTAQKELLQQFGLVPATQAELNVFRGVVQPVWEPMFTDVTPDAWYLFADPNTAPAIIFAFLSGYESLKITPNYDWNTNVMWWTCFQAFGAAIRSHRPVAKNAGV